MSEQNIIEAPTKSDVIRINLGDWLYNAGIVGVIKILSSDTNELNPEIKIYDTYIEFNRSLLHGLTDKFFEVAFSFHGKFDSINNWLLEVKNDVECFLKGDRIESIVKKHRLERVNQEDFCSKIVEGLAKRWKGVAYEKFQKVKKSEINNINELLTLIERLIGIQNFERNYFIEKEVQTFLRGIIGGGSFLNRSVSSDQKKLFRQDFELPIKDKANRDDRKYNCIHCNSRKAKANTIFSTGLVFYQGLNKDSINFTWGFNPNLPLCEICELVYFCHWAGYTKGINNKNYLFVNDDSSINNLWEKNQLLAKILQNDKKENILIDYFYELLLQEEQIKSTYSLQNIALIEVDLEKEVMPKVLSLHVSRNQARFIKGNHDHLKWLASRYYKIKEEYTNILHEFLRLMLGNKLNFGIVHRLVKYYLQSKDESKNFVAVNYSTSIIQQLVLLISHYFKTVKKKALNMEPKYIWHIYHLGNDMQKSLKDRQAENKINGIAYRLLNAVRANDKSTFLNVVLRLYIGYNMEVPKSLVNTLESEEKFQVIGHSYINGLLGELLGERSDQKQQTIS